MCCRFSVESLNQTVSLFVCCLKQLAFQVRGSSRRNATGAPTFDPSDLSEWPALGNSGSPAVAGAGGRSSLCRDFRRAVGGVDSPTESAANTSRPSPMRPTAPVTATASQPAIPSALAPAAVAAKPEQINSSAHGFAASRRGTERTQPPQPDATFQPRAVMHQTRASYHHGYGMPSGSMLVYPCHGGQAYAASQPLDVAASEGSAWGVAMEAPLEGGGGRYGGVQLEPHPATPVYTPNASQQYLPYGLQWFSPQCYAPWPAQNQCIVPMQQPVNGPREPFVHQTAAHIPHPTVFCQPDVAVPQSTYVGDAPQPDVAQSSGPPDTPISLLATWKESLLAVSPDKLDEASVTDVRNLQSKTKDDG